MTTDRLPNPGHVLPLCRGCQHRADPFLPIPCLLVHWEGARHVKPDLERSASGVVVCSDYMPVEVQVDAAALEPEGAMG
jgi:hypothetical protein